MEALATRDVDSLMGVSIIIPIYNVEQYIEECLDSVIGQTYNEIEIILIDDGSTDRSGKIADRYALKDKRIKVIHKKNGGLSDARNAGVVIAKCDYIMFVDSDDYVDSTFVETALLKIKVHRADILCFRFMSVDDSGRTKISSKNTKHEYKTYSNIESMKDIFSIGGSLKVNAWNKIYKRSLFVDNSILYPVERVYEDNLTTYKLMYFAKKVVFIDKSLLLYRQRPGSITKNKLTAQNIKERIGMLSETIDWLDGKLTGLDIVKIQRIYRKTLLTVMMNEAVMKKQAYRIPAILFEIIKNNKRNAR